LFNAALRTPERALTRLNFSREHRKEAQMAAILIPVLWVGGAVVLRGGGWYVIGHMVHCSAISKVQK
jgi:hypothetical protein